MKLLSLSYKNLLQEWEFENINFFDLTLLVGISGVGKTQILEAINTLKKVVNGESANGIEWDMIFIANNNKKYHWSGTFEQVEYLNDISELVGFAFEGGKKIKPKIKNERLIINDDKPIVERSANKILFKNNKMPKLSNNESCINIFKEEDDIKPIIEAFKKIIFRDHTQKEGISWIIAPNKLRKDKFQTLEAIRACDLSTIEKLEIVYNNLPDIFKQIKERFIDIFSQIQDVKVELIKGRGLPVFVRTPILFIKEKYVNKWISQDKISSGMLRTFLHISELFLWSDGTVILIDEFENSLGVNCIDVLTEDLVFENRRIQFIATSHHPYIINKIPYDYWKIVTRRGGKIKTHDAKDFDLGDSHHERFMNLINLPHYRQGLTI